MNKPLKEQPLIARISLFSAFANEEQGRNCAARILGNPTSIEEILPILPVTSMLLEPSTKPMEPVEKIADAVQRSVLFLEYLPIEVSLATSNYAYGVIAGIYDSLNDSR